MGRSVSVLHYMCLTIALRCTCISKTLQVSKTMQNVIFPSLVAGTPSPTRSAIYAALTRKLTPALKNRAEISTFTAFASLEV